MSSYVLDASALCALLFNEPGHKDIIPLLGDAEMSVVNLTEVLSKAVQKKRDFNESRRIIANLPIRMVPYDEPQAVHAALLWAATKPLGLSLGDRACLALGAARKLPVLTSDGNWRKLDIGVKVVVFR